MARSVNPKIKESDITGLKYFDRLAPLLQRLHDDGSQRDKAGNRNLHYDQLCMLTPVSYTHLTLPTIYSV